MSWLPLESNPEVMTKFLHLLGVEESWCISDVYGLDDELLGMVPQPVAAVILLFPITQKYGELHDEKNARINSSENRVSQKVFYMKQKISNACGTIAMLHSVGNNLHQVVLNPGSLKDFFHGAEEKMGQGDDNYHEGLAEIGKVHNALANEGQSAVPSENDPVDLHFVAFVPVEGDLYELDGRKDGPLNLGPIGSETFLKAAARECKLYMESDPENIHFSVVALTKSN